MVFNYNYFEIFTVGAYHVWMGIHLSFMQNNSNKTLPMYSFHFPPVLLISPYTKWSENTLVTQQVLWNYWKYSAIYTYIRAHTHAHIQTMEALQWVLEGNSPSPGRPCAGPHAQVCRMDRKTNQTNCILLLKSELIDGGMLHCFLVDVTTAIKMTLKM